MVRGSSAQATAPRAPRRRRTPDEAEHEILTAAERLFRELPAREVTVSRIMAATTLTRKSFYVYFRDRPALISRLVAGIRHDADEAMLRLMREDSDMVVAGRAALHALARLYAEHGELIRALIDVSSDDPEALEVWRSFIDPIRTGLTERVKVEMTGGRVAGIDPAATVNALMLMNLGCFFDQLVGVADPDIDGLVDVLFTIWLRTLYAPADLVTDAD